MKVFVQALVLVAAIIPKAAADQPVAAATMSVECNNLHFDKLSTQEQDFVALQVGQSFNAISDKQLDNVKFDSDSKFGYGSSRIDIAHLSGILIGSQGCWPCVGDKSFDIDEFNKDWAMKLEEHIRQGPHASLAGASSCKVEMNL